MTIPQVVIRVLGNADFGLLGWSSDHPITAITRFLERIYAYTNVSLSRMR